MQTKFLTAAAAAALMLTTGGQALAQNGYGDGYGRGDPAHGGMRHQGGYSDDDFGSGYNGRFSDNDYGRFSYDDFGDRGRFYQRGNVAERFQRLRHFISFQERTGRINRFEARRANDMLQSIRYQARQFRRDGFVSPRERMVLNNRLDRLVQFLRQSRRDHDDPRDYRR